MAEAGEFLRPYPTAACETASPLPSSGLPERLADDFGDVPTLFASRQWLQQAIEAKGAKITGGGMGGGQCDLWFMLDGCEFMVSLKPVLEKPEKGEEA